MLGQIQVRTLGQGSDDAVGTRREIAGSSPKVIRGLPVTRRKLTKGDRGLAGSLPGARRSSLEDAGKFAESSDNKGDCICMP
ncbi:hypothetical protein GW17_00062010 [Ensete ventricosum]|nr:hypothetical protein GW17_00062010 [Ensete ventricosum]